MTAASVMRVVTNVVGTTLSSPSLGSLSLLTAVILMTIFLSH